MNQNLQGLIEIIKQYQMIEVKIVINMTNLCFSSVNY